MKIALVSLPNPVLLAPEAHFQLGLLYVGSALKRSGYEVEIVDLRARKWVGPEDVPEADVVGVTATTGEMQFARSVLALAHAQGAKTMIGGAHATFLPEDCAEYYIDYIIKGDGEMAVVQALRNKTIGIYEVPLPSLGGIFPDWSLIVERGFSRELFPGAGYGQGPLAAGILTSRGCGFHCSYCRSERDKIRLRPIAEVCSEIEKLKATYGVNHFRFYDENVTNPKLRALGLFMALEPLGIHIRAHTRSDAIDDELAEAFKRAGGEEVGFGFEAASDHVLEKVRKQETVAQHREAVRVCQRAGLISKAFWMVGLPGQGWPEIEAIKRFMLEERPEKWIVSLFTPYPGSDVWAHPESYGVTFLDRDFGKYWNFPSWPCVAYEDNPAEEVWRQYQDLKAWLDKEFPHGRC